MDVAVAVPVPTISIVTVPAAVETAVTLAATGMEEPVTT
jgi:hypothetical protein